jgi:hypothetical protein
MGLEFPPDDLYGAICMELSDGGGVTAFRVRMELDPSSWAYPERHLYCNPGIQYSH